MSDWKSECIKWRGHILTGEHGHYCLEWDQLPVDETCPEWPCGCIVTGYPDGITRRNGEPYVPKMTLNRGVLK
jgi:hypothetical protein